MIHSATISQNSTSGMWTATWLTRHSSNGINATGRDPIEALENLAAALREHDENQAAIRQAST